MLTIEEIRKAHAAIPEEAVAVPDWGGEVVVRGMTGRERDEFELSMSSAARERRPVKDVRARALVKLVKGADGKPLFGEADAGWLSQGPARPLGLLWDVAARLSGLTEKEAKDLEGNSGAAPSGGSGSS